MTKLAKVLMAKSDAAYKSALTLFRAEDYDGAANRAYYAMHDAAKAALVHIGIPGAEEIRSHSGLISEFSKHLVKTGMISKDVGRLLSRAEQVRLVADYSGASLDKAKAREHLANSEQFIGEVNKNIIKGIEIE